MAVRERVGGRPRLRDTAHTVLVACDDEASGRAHFAAAVEALRPALALKRPRPLRVAGTPRRPREGTKREAVLALLRRPDGAAVAQIAEATGWQAHTVRGFFAGLKRRQGIAVQVLERIRQVGPGREGAKGPYSVYRITDAG